MLIDAFVINKAKKQNKTALNAFRWVENRLSL